MPAAAWLLLVYGIAVGVSLGLTGGGGSIITVPLLVYLVGEPVHDAIATSLVVVGGVALFGFASRVRQADSWGGLVLGCVGLFGAVPGRIAAQYFSGRVLLLLFAIIMLVAALAMFRSHTYQAAPPRRRNWMFILLCGVALGFLTGFLGVGGGFLIVPVLALFLGMPMSAAIPTSLLVIGINCVASLLGSALFTHASHKAGAIVWPVALTFLVGGIVGSLLGASMAQRLNARSLKRVFGVFVFAVGLFVAGSATGLIPFTVK